MHRWFLLLTFCALALAVPRNNVPVDLDDREFSTRTESKVIHIGNSAEFAARLAQAGEELVVVFSMASWCPFSRNIIPTVEDIAANSKGLIVLQIDIPSVETTPGVAWEYGVTSVAAIPTFSFIRSGILLEQYASGDAELLRNTVARYLAGSARDYTLLQ